MSRKISQTSQMRVDNTTFMIERLAQDCAPYQYIRELTQNSLDAIRRKRELGWEGQGVIEWDVDWAIVQSTGFYKLQITDNGTGMGPHEIERYINQLSSSTGTQSMEQNFGIGAKITAGVENPKGLVYKSWTANHPTGIFATLWKDEEANVYGLRQYEVDNSYQHYAPLSHQVEKPECVIDSGTSVVLMGKADTENTYLRPNEKAKWLISYLNERYFELPDNTTLKVRDFNNADASSWPLDRSVPMGPGGSQMRTVRGKRHFLDQNSEKKGILNLSNATLYWFILPETLNVSGGVWDEKSQVGAIYQDELYEVKRMNAARSEMIHFGINYGFNRVVIYIKPDTTKFPIFANTSRSGLLINGEPLPWTQWHSEFRQNMPQEIREMMDSILVGADTGNYEENIKRRWREIKELFQLSKYRRLSSGDLIVDGFTPGGTPRDLHGIYGIGSTKPSPRKSDSGGNSDLYAAFISEEGVSGQVVSRESNLPKSTWICAADGTREKGDLEDRAARYNREENTIYINRDFRVFEGLRKVTSESYPHASEVDVKRSIEEMVSLQLTETVMGILSLQGSPEWSDASTVELGLSPESLTAAVMPRYAAFSLIKRQLGGIVGAPPKV